MKFFTLFNAFRYGGRGLCDSYRFARALDLRRDVGGSK